MERIFGFFKNIFNFFENFYYYPIGRLRGWRDWTRTETATKLGWFSSCGFLVFSLLSGYLAPVATLFCWLVMRIDCWLNERIGLAEEEDEALTRADLSQLVGRLVWLPAVTWTLFWAGLHTLSGSPLAVGVMISMIAFYGINYIPFERIQKQKVESLVPATVNS